MVNRGVHPNRFFTKEEKDRIVRAIREAELKTSGEIRVYLERKSRDHVMEHAKKVFEKLRMTHTEHHNGILIYFSLRDHNFAILGDKGIHENVGDDFWKAVVSQMETRFAKDDFAGGLEAAIREMGERLKRFFPWEPSDINELPDKVEPI